MFNIIASDLDGTLLSSNNKLTFFTKKTLKILISHGIYFILATGRHHTDVFQIFKNLDICTYMITANGARIYNAKNELIYSHDLDQDIAAALSELVYQDKQITTNIFRNDEWFINRHPINQIKLSKFRYQIYKLGTLPTGGICKIYFYSYNQEKLLLLEKLINLRWGKRVNVSFSLPVCLEVMAGGISKGFALNKVVNLLGYKLRDCISFGDGMNDQEMLTITGKGCIMNNAQQRLKDKLPLLEIIGSNTNEAVSHYLRKIYIKNNFFKL